MYLEEPLYRIEKSYLENAEKGPFFSGSLPPFPEEKSSHDFLGHKVNSPFGIFAGPLLNSRWVSLAARLGFDILTYKTIRSIEHPGHSLPNITFVEGKSVFHPSAPPKSVVERRDVPPLKEIAITNSFGMPSRSKEYLKKDISESQRTLKKGQVLIVSFVGTPPKSPSKELYVEDFVKAEELAIASGAKVLEANFSCPNVSKEEGALYLDEELCLTLGKKLVARSHAQPLIVKVGTYPNEEVMKKSFIAFARAGIRAVAGINSYSMEVTNQEGAPALGKDRLRSGICGAPIRPLALHFVERARKIIDEEKLDLLLIGGGGIVHKDHFPLFLSRGAHFVFAATGWMWDPYLALRAKGVIS